MAKKKPAPKASEAAAKADDASSSLGTEPAAPQPQLSRYQKFTRARVHRSQLKNATYNPRQITAAAARNLRAGLKTHGLVNALVWNKRTGNLIGGHQRISQLDALEAESGGNYLLDVDAVDVDEKTERALNILLNNPTVQGQFDLAKLEDLMGHLHAQGYDVHKTGFGVSDMQTLFSDEFMASFLPQHAQQAVAEAPVVDQLEAIRLAGKSAKAAANPPPQPQSQGAASDGQGSIGEVDATGLVDGVLPGDHDGAGGSPIEVADEPSAGAPPQAEMTPEEYQQLLKDRRQNYIKKAQTLDDAADVHIMIVFDSPADLGKFITDLGLDPEKRTFDFVEVRRALGMDG